MKFIIWTIVWFGLFELDQVLSLGFPYEAKGIAMYGDNVMGLAAGLSTFVWIFCYYLFIKD